MQMGKAVTRIALSFAIVGTAGALSGCQSFRDAMGASKAPPDEFTVVTAAPLIVPPDFNLQPPRPGEAPRNIQDPSAQARAALYSVTSDAAAAQLPNTYSDAEKTLLARSGAANTDPAVRQQISRETHYEAGDPALTDRVLSGNSGIPAPAPAPAPDAAAPAVTPPPATPGQ